MTNQCKQNLAQKRRIPGVASLSALGVLIAALAGCQAVTPVVPAPMEFGEAFTSGATKEARDQSDGRWWQAFGDAGLNALVSQGLSENFSLQAAWARLRQSRAVAEQLASGQSPSLTFSLGRSRDWRDSGTSDAWQAGLTTEYELDFWGRVAALDQQGQLDALATQSAGRVLANTVAAQITQNWFGLVRQQQAIRLLKQQQSRVKQSLSATKARFRRGLVGRADVWQQEQLLEGLKSDVIQAQQQHQLYWHQLSLWRGKESGLSLVADASNSVLFETFSESFPASLPELSAQPGPDVPSVSLVALANRPDVQQSWYELQADNAELAAAVANRYPRLTLSASYSGSAPRWEDVMDNWVANLAANLVLPILDGGNRKATVVQRTAAVDESLASYQQALFEAANEVRDAQVNEAAVVQQIDSLNKQLVLARKTEAYQQSSYRRGGVTLLALITAQRSVLTLEQQRLELNWQRLQQRIQLYRAVSHGRFSDDDSSTPSSISPAPSGAPTAFIITFIDYQGELA